MTEDQRIEAAAKAMRAKRAELQHAPLDRIYGDLFKAAIAAYLAGDVVVPREPTVKQMSEAGKAIAKYIRKMNAAGGDVEATDYALRVAIYRAALPSVPDGKSGEEK